MTIQDAVKNSGFDDYAAENGGTYFLLKGTTLYKGIYVYGEGGTCRFDQIEKVKSFESLDYTEINNLIWKERNRDFLKGEDRNAKPQKITLAQVASAIANASATIINGVVLYGCIQQNPLSLEFSWDDDGCEFTVEIDEDNVIAIEQTHDTTVKITYQEGGRQETVEISILQLKPFNFN